MKQLFVAVALVISLASFKPDQMNQKWSMVIHAGSVSLNSSILTLGDVNQLVTLSTAEGEREVRAVTLSAIIENWDKLFATSEPNACVMTVIDNKPVESVVRLGKPKLIHQKLTFPIEQLGKEENFQAKEAVLFVDLFGINPNSGPVSCHIGPNYCE